MNTSELVGYLNDAYNEFVRIAITVDQVKAYQRVFCAGFAANINDLVIAKMLLDLRLECE